MDKENHKAKPGDGLRSLKSTMLFRAINYELYIRPNKVIMIFGAIAMFSCIGYMAYMRHNSDNTKYYAAVTSDGSIDIKQKTSKWTVKIFQHMLGRIDAMEQNPRINYVRSSIPHYNLYENLSALNLVQILEQGCISFKLLEAFSTQKIYSTSYIAQEIIASILNGSYILLLQHFFVSYIHFL